jgi:hypothetical protein
MLGKPKGTFFVIPLHFVFMKITRVCAQQFTCQSGFSELQPNLCTNLSLPRRHSMISIGIGEAGGGGSLNSSQPTAKEEKKVSKSAWGKV